MAEPMCGFGEQEPCRRPAPWAGMLKFGPWWTVVYLCEEHVPHFQHMIDHWSKGIAIMGSLGINKEIVNVRNPEVTYGQPPPREHWPLTCDICGQPLVRHRGVWKVRPQPMQFLNEDDAHRYQRLLDHEHRPG